ncbi:hypothetical protein [Pseudomonas putida]|uniref:hypothetical protein n=1 Tax=Pseudomonas putida TaxID=303 RepID=UPI0011469DE8|nr:hypothetical protein [Pseudomonas putida]
MSTIVKFSSYEERLEDGEVLDELLRLKPWDYLQADGPGLYAGVLVERTSFRSSSDSGEDSEFHIIARAPYTLAETENTQKTDIKKSDEIYVQLDFPDGSAEIVTNPAARNLFRNASAHTLLEYGGNSYYIERRRLIWNLPSYFDWVITLTKLNSAE